MVSMYQVITANGPAFLHTIKDTDNGRAILSAGVKTRKTRKDAKQLRGSTDSSVGGRGDRGGEEEAGVRAAGGAAGKKKDEGEGRSSGEGGAQRARRALPSSDSE